MTPIPTWPQGDGCSSSDDENELEDLESQGYSTSSLYGSLQQDHQQDMAEDGLCRASRDFLEPQRTDCPSKGCPQRVYKRRFSSDYSISPTSLGEAQVESEGSNYGQEEDRLSGQSDISLYPTKALTGHNRSPGSAGSADSMPESICRFGDSSEYPTSAPTGHYPRPGSAGSVDSMPESIGQFDDRLEYSTNAPTGHYPRPSSAGSVDSMAESISQFGDSSEYPSELEAASSLGDSHPRITPTESFQSHFLSPLSPEELQHTPSANGKVNSDASSEKEPGSLMGAVNQTGSATSQDLSNSKAQVPHSPDCKVGREESNSPFQWGGNQPLDQIQKSKKVSSAVLHSQFSGSFCPFSPSESSTPKRLNQSRAPKKGVNVPAHSSSEVSKYGRGQLNYPLPDFSKVEPKVRFPKDEESYRPPKGKNHSRQFQGPTRPLIYKSPAEIVREVLLSSGDNSPPKASLPSYTVTRVPKEFQTPQQATELVQQLQEDYHKLLTKYAEAENTIDQLRLGAKVNLYSDPPKASHGVHMGSMPHGTKVMSFTIPQAKTAEWQTTTSPGPQALLDPELSATRSDLIPSPAAAYPGGGMAGSSGTSTQGPSLGDRLTQTLANKVAKFLAQVGSFEGLVQEGRLAPQDQLKGFWRLKEEQDALEKAFLWARGEHRRVQQLQTSDVPPGEFDPNREVEGEIFRLGMHLEELMDGIDDLRPDQLSLRTPPEEKSHGSSAASPVSDLPTLCPALSAQAPMPTVCTPYPETPAVQNGHPFLSRAHTEVSSASSELDDESPALPQSLQYKQLQMEQEFQSLTAQYHSIKLFPDAVKLEEDQEEKDSAQEVDGPVAGNSNTFDPSPRRTEKEEGRHPNPLEECVEQTQLTQPQEIQSSTNGGHHLSGLPRGSVAQPHPPAPKNTLPVSEQKQPLSHQSSTASLAGSGVSGSLPLQKAFPSANTPQVARNFDVSQYKEHRIVSPETDSGFVGSETSRTSPLTQTPEHRLSHTSMSFGTSDPRRLPQSSTACLPQTPSSHQPGRDQLDVRVPSGLSTSGAQAQRSDPMSITPPKKWAKGFHHKPGLRTKTADLDGEAHDRAHEQYSHGRKDDQSLAPIPSEAEHQETAQDPLRNLICREVRDRAIRSLQQEVTRLRERIEASLNNPPRDTSSHSFQHSTRARSRLTKDPLNSGSSSHTSKSAQSFQSDRGDTTQNNSSVRLRLRSSSVPREGPQPTQTSESEQSRSRIRTEQSRAEEQSPSDRKKGGTRGKQADTGYFRGHYTGHKYSVTSSQHFQIDNNSRSCPRCHSMRKKLPDNTPRKDPEKLFPQDSIKKTQCPMCHRPRSPTEKNREASGIDKGTQKGAPLSSGPTRKSEQRQEQSSPPSLPHPPGVWYLAPPLQAPVGATFAYVPPVPVVPYSSSTLYYSPVSPTSASSPLHYSSGKKPAEVRPLSQSRRAPSPMPGHRCSSELDLVDLDDLNLSLSRAVKAAKNVELTTKQMSRSLSAGLHRARGLRGSCLF